MSKPRAKRSQPRSESFTIGWICALPVELAAAQEMLDDKYEEFKDKDSYIFGRVGENYVVLVCLPAGQIGNNSAAVILTKLQSRFPSIRLGIIVGIGGGVPSATSDVRLGDVVVSQPSNGFGGVVQYDFGKTGANGHIMPTGFLNAPPVVLLNAIARVQANHHINRNMMLAHLSVFDYLPNFTRESTDLDVLFKSTYQHIGGITCEDCKTQGKDSVVERVKRGSQKPEIHYGTIASGNQLIKDGVTRDRLSSELGGILCFEMEAVEFMNSLPCIVVRGICDYADSHRNKKWQGYAAAVAAAYAKELLLVLPAAEIMTVPILDRALKDKERSPSILIRSTRPDSSISWKQVNNSSDPEITTYNKEEQLTYKNLLESLGFKRMDERLLNIKTAHGKTCIWLFEQAQFKDWLNNNKAAEHYGFLWLKGKPGSGKSTIMKTALAWNKRRRSRETVISYFFNAHALSVLEKSSLGMYRSLVYQLVQGLPYLQNHLTDCFYGKQRDGVVDDWTVEELQHFLHYVVESLKERPLVIYIDALDGGEEDDIRQMVNFLEEIAQVSIDNRKLLRVCLSSRHYPYLSTKKGLSVFVEGQSGHGQDIKTYVRNKLLGDKSTEMEALRTTLHDKSSGVFLWVVLVVPILNKLFDHGQVRAMKKRLYDLPETLNDLFAEILARDTDNADDSILLLQWNLFARRPLSPIELYSAVRCGSTDSQNLTKESTSKGIVERYILNCSRGLTEVTTSQPPAVQFIHESVRDFLMRENGLAKLRPVLQENVVGSSQDQLRKCCSRYLFSVANAMSSDRDESGKKRLKTRFEAMKFQEDQSKQFPFLEYAVCNILHHADAAHGYGVSQDNFVTSFLIRDWITLDNLFQKYQKRRHKSDASLLSILEERNLPNLIRIILNGAPGSVVNPTDSGYSTMDSKKAAGETLDDDSCSIMTDNEFLSIKQSTKNALISALAKELSQSLETAFDGSAGTNDMSASIRKVVDILPALLKGLSVELKINTTTKIGRSTSIFVRHHRRHIATSFSSLMESVVQHGDVPEVPPYDLPTDDLGMSVNEKMSMWDVEEGAGLSVGLERQPELKYLDDAELDPAEPGELTIPHLDEARPLIVESRAYAELLAKIRSIIRLTSSQGTLFGDIKLNILNAMATHSELAPGNRSGCRQCRFEVDWDPVLFFETQYPDQERPHISHVITLTGTAVDAQATTCLEYMQQVWPITGPEFLQALQECFNKSLSNSVLQHSSFHCIDPYRYIIMIILADSSLGELHNRTNIQIQLLDAKVVVEVIGFEHIIVEIAEQLSWLGAACRASPDEKTMASAYSHIVVKQGSTLCFEIGYSLEPLESTEPLCEDGKCWYQLFRNPVIVHGFPILARQNSECGLELPLEMMVGLGLTYLAIVFGKGLLIKGFSSMFVPTCRFNRSLQWHFICNGNDHLTYLEADKYYPGRVSSSDFELSRLKTVRHFVGWSSSVMVNIGTQQVDYERIGYSNSQFSSAGYALERVTVSGGSYLTAGASFVRAERDTSLRLPHSNVYQLQVYQAKTMIVTLYDTQQRRGWLVDGASALLHIVCAKISSPPLKHASSFNVSDLCYADPTGGDNAAYATLTNERNMNIVFFKGTNTLGANTTNPGGQSEGYGFQQLVRETWDALEIIDTQQAKIAETHGQTWHLFQERLDGFDFRSVVEGDLRIRPKFAVIKDGQDWVYFLKQIRAISLFGIGYGNLIQPAQDTNPLCNTWSMVPTNQDYLTVNISLLQRICTKWGNRGSVPLEIAPGVYWNTGAKIFEPCADCQFGRLANSCSRLQLMCKSKPKLHCSHSILQAFTEMRGAVIFGRKRSSLRRDFGGSRTATSSPDDVDLMEDSGLGTSITTTSVLTAASASEVSVDSGGRSETILPMETSMDATTFSVAGLCERETPEV